jgi:hypothetical protein
MKKLSYNLSLLVAASSILFAGSCKQFQKDRNSNLKAGIEADITVSLAHRFDVRNEEYELMFASSPEIEQVGVCLRKGQSTCSRVTTNYFETKVIYATSARRFYALTSTALLEQNMVLELVAYNKAGSETGRRAITFNYSGTPPTSTGIGATNTGSVSTAGFGNAATSGGASGGVSGEALVIRTCSGGTCHNNTYAANPASLRGNADAARRISEGNMPPGNTMPQSERQTLLRFMGL